MGRICFLNQSLVAAMLQLGTNDAKDIGHGGPANWPHDCTGESQLSCAFSKDYASMIELVKTLGNSSS